MPTYQVTAPDGRKLRLTGEAPPTDADLDEIFSGLPEPKAVPPLYGGADAKLSPGEGESLFSRLRTAVMGDPDRAAAKAAGIGLNPTPAEMIEGPLIGGAMLSPLSPGVATGVGTANAGMAAMAGNIPAAVVDLALTYVPGGKLLKGAGLLARIGRSARVAEEAAPMVEAPLSAAERANILQFMRSPARVAATEAPAVAEAVPAAGRAYQGVPSLMNIAGAGTEDVAATAVRAKEGAEGARSILKGLGSKAPATAAVPATAPVAEEAAKALEREIEAKVIRLKTGVGKGLSAEQLTESVEEIYKVPTKAARAIVTRVFKEQRF